MKNKRQDEKVKKKRKNRPCIYRNKTWRDKMKKSLKTDRGRAQREQRDFRNKRCKEKQKTPTVDGTGVRRGSVSLRHLLTDNLTNLSQFFVGVFSVADLHLIWMLSLTHVWWWKCQEISVGGVFAFKKCVFRVCLCWCWSRTDLSDVQLTFNPNIRILNYSKKIQEVWFKEPDRGAQWLTAQIKDENVAFHWAWQLQKK